MSLFRKKSKYRIRKLGDNYLVEISVINLAGFLEIKDWVPCDVDGAYIPICDFIDSEYGIKNGFSPAKFKTKKEANDFIKLHDC